MFKKGVMRDFSGCSWCGLPQYICTHWEAVGDDQGTYRLRRDRECQYAGLLVSVWGAASVWYETDVNEVMGKMDVERQYDWQDTDDQEIYGEGLMKWLGDKVQMGSLETSRFC